MTAPVRQATRRAALLLSAAALLGAPAPAPAAAGTTVTRTTTIVTGSPALHRATAGSGGLSALAILAAVVGGLILLACLVWAIFRMRAYEPSWLLALRHSLAEAGFRASATWAEFTDWVRLGH
ncbi:MAG: hypothetical protein ACLQBB_14005 [Solirubrobacteraceae bacterium]